MMTSMEEEEERERVERKTNLGGGEATEAVGGEVVGAAVVPGNISSVQVIGIQGGEEGSSDSIL